MSHLHTPTRRIAPLASHRWHLATVLALACGAALAQPQPEPTAPEIRHAQAQEAYERGHYAQAFAAFAALADQGHADAARTAALMARFGPVLYGQSFALAPERLALWRGRLPAYTTAAAR